ncbi:MAG TPA: DegT/DnrJ/EryC1/StrS family aminotransferase [Pyrinomonadaceae bacterium]|jgi:dTDP-4-amino-4,6-dideoxygalactose transaminase|nr:DegT/DnrJ/EryC1/StrS family aminotransferase [Pyrinomonadaceae bacterium]
MIPLVDLKAQYQSIKSEVDGAIAEVLDSCQFILGPKVEAFETEFAAYCQSRFAFGVNSGTSALHLALLAAGIGPGDEVITVSYTFVATIAAILYTGAAPVFVDIDPLTCNIDPAKIEAAITPKTKVIMPVHLYGTCAEMDPILEIARRHNLLVIEDAAQAVGAEYNGRRAGSMGDLACFSFYPGKNLGAYGEAGAVVTNNEKYVEIIKELRDQGQSAKYLHQRVGYNFRMEAIQGAILGVKLKHLDDWTAARRQHAKTYSQALSDSGLRLLLEPAACKSVYHIFPLFTDQRDELRDHLQANGISSGIHYPIPVHMQRGFNNLGFSEGDLPETEQVCREVMSLPMYPELTDETVKQISESVLHFCRRSLAVHT